ncbi:guanyl-nucleotide exchange factor [Sporothrix brasiliensis 5110]|uniref:Guanyl-nucleotide exchange factor n=1 Tax=Sporothrix brasiliensis 5110 TaxID=1398154 RepID=A0A0C2IHP7_9PEZI|nr:guanyl-nucleotide exchange factor [Sporothrix brasiliensis 5110]KIH88686.1 guanyl-nucleotide exchange factor [Sporothrix brasiliensis 5110]
MPFLRRRGVMASESDMRRHTSIFNLPLSAPKLPQQQQPKLPEASLPRPDLATTQSEPVVKLLGDPVAASSASDDLGNAVSAAGTAAAISVTQPSTPATPATPATPSNPAMLPPSTPPFNGRHNSSAREDTRGAVSIDSDYLGRPESPPIQEQTPKHRRFSLLRFRNASDSQLAARARQQAHAEEAIPPIPHPPEIIMTAPTFELGAAPQKRQNRMKLPNLARKSSDLPRINDVEEPVGRTSNTFGSWSKRERRKSMIAPLKSHGKQPAVAFDESAIVQQQQQQQQQPNPQGHSPPEYGDEAGTTLALPVNRLSESSRSDGSSGDRVYGSTTTTTHTVSTTTTFFRLSRRRKNSNPPSLFPISHLPQKGQPTTPIEGAISENSTDIDALNSKPPPPRAPSRGVGAFGRGGLGGLGVEEQDTPTQSRPVSQRHGASTPPRGLAPSPAMALFHKGNPSPASAFFRPSSRNSGHSSPTRSIPGAHGPLGRGRSSTMSSVGRDSAAGRESVDEHLTPPTLRSSSSATGRKSFSDLLGLSRLRQNSEPNRQGALTPVTPCSSTSKNNSLHLPRDSFVLPERREDDTPAKYLARLEEVVSRSVIGSALSKSSDPFSQAVLRSYMRSFKFFTDPMDMAIRKLLMDAELPRETQHIDRFLQAFANRYHECNPGIFSTPDQAYFIAFSLLILHTDVFNKNNKHKMQKSDYQKNTRGEGIFDEILEVFYDNITYTPFIHVEDDIDINGERIVAHKAKRKNILPNGGLDIAKKSSKEPIDPYTLIIDDKLDILRPNLKDVMQLDDPYSYLGTAKSLNMKELQTTFFRTGVLQIVSARSRPDAFMTEKTVTNPQEAHPGIVDIKITKVGLLWRKDAKKKKTRSPWQEWGAILTGAQLYFFRNTSWVKNLMHQYETHIKHGHDGIPIIFKPPLEEFKPDGLMSTNGAVALLDSSYKKHKHAFTYVSHGGVEEILLADNEDEMNDWLAKLNYAAAFRTSGVRMRGVVGGFYEGQDRRAIRRVGSDDGQSVQTPTGEVTITRSRIDHKMAHDILAARRDIMIQKIEDANQKLEEQGKRLEVQLRNSRHLQILAPIQPKTREQMLISAARMDTQLKMTRMTMWRLKCHKDILEMDLDDERQLAFDPEHALESGAAFAGIVGVSPATSGMVALNSGALSSAVDKPAQLHSQHAQLHREESKASTSSTVLPRSPKSAARRGSLASGSIGSGGAATGPVAPDSPTSDDVFQTPPTSATGAAFFQHKHQTSSDVAAAGLDFTSLRKASVSSAMSSGPSIAATPPRAVRSLNSAHESTPSSSKQAGPTSAAQNEDNVDPNDVDADEHSLLQKTGLLESVATSTSGSAGGAGKNKPVGLEDTGSIPYDSKQQYTPDASQTSQHDKNKIRRSLQRTLREGAGHLSTRGRKPKDASTTGGQEEAADEPIILERGTGSFVVHGKKASVINFGGDFSSILPPDERLRQRKQQQQQEQQQQQQQQPRQSQHSQRLPTVPDSASQSTAALVQPPSTGQDDASLLSSSNGGENSIHNGSTDNNQFGIHSDSRVAMFQDRERRESAASASTATARSFRELHRKYSSVRAASRSSTGGKALISDDDESEAAVSNSEGRHTPLPLGPDEAGSNDRERKRKKYLSGVGEASGSEEERRAVAANVAPDSDDNIDDDDDDDDESNTGNAVDAEEFLSVPSSAAAQAQFFTPDPPASPASPALPLQAPESADATDAEEPGPSQKLQAVQV